MIPTYEQIMLPFLTILKDGNEHSLNEVHDNLAKQFKLSDSERKELLPSGKQPIFRNRLGWAKAHLKKAGLLADPKRAHYKITKRGIKLLEENPEKVDSKLLTRYNDYLKFLSKPKPEEHLSKNKQSESKIDFSEETPEESLEYAHQKLKNNVTTELLQTIKESSPEFFEKLVIDLLIKMGYGGSRKNAGEALGRTGDGGIDGSIREDKLGLDTIYVQAKKWGNSVPISAVRDFAGALLSRKSKKGIFITTSGFPKSAHEYVNSIEHRVRLINGEELTELMFEYNLGVSTVSTYEIKGIDSDYFIES